MAKLALHLLVLALAAPAVLAIEHEGVVTVGEAEVAGVLQAKATPAPTPTPSANLRSADADLVKLSLFPSSVMWNRITGFRTNLRITVQNPTGRLRRIAISWGDGELSEFDIYYDSENILKPAELPDLLTERHGHAYKGCAPEIPIRVRLYAITFDVAWVDNGIQVFETEYPSEVAAKVTELGQAGFTYHVTPGEYIRADYQDVVLRVNGCY